MLNIYIARHGQDIDNKNGILNGRRNGQLTDIGREQAEDLALKIKDFGLIFDAIYSSPLIRAQETAEIISKIINGPTPINEDLLIERDFGVLAGKTKSDIEKLSEENIFRTRNVSYFLLVEGAETFPEIINRAGLLLDKLNIRHGSGNILLVCHGDIGKMIYAKHFGLDWKTSLTQLVFGNCDLILLTDSTIPNKTHVFQAKQYNTE